MKLITRNLTQDGSILTTASSSNVNYPVSNLAHQFKSKVWRSSGNFTVDSTNNKIDFDESGGELTATITSGSYTSTTLAAEIKTQLEAVGAETYTVSYSSTTGKWLVSSAGGYLSLLNNTGTNQAVSLLKNSLGFADSDRTGSTSYTAPKIAIHTEECVLFDTYTSDSIDAFVCLFPNSDGNKFSSSAVLTLQASQTNSWAAPAVSQVLTVDNSYDTYSHFFATAQEYRYWRIHIVDTQNVNLYVEIGVIILGLSESVDSADNGFSYMLQDTSIVSRNLYGNEYVDEYPQIATLELGFSNVDYSDIVILENAYKQNGTKTPVFVALDDTAAVFGKNHFSIYGKMQPNLEIGQVNYDIFNTSLIIKETV